MDISWERKFISVSVSLISLPRIFFKRDFPILLKKILIIEWGYLGDTIVATPAIRNIRINFPTAEISLLTNPENKEYTDTIDFVDKIIYINNPFQLGRKKFSIKSILHSIKMLRSQHYDLVIEFSGRLTAQFFLFFIRLFVFSN